MSIMCTIFNENYIHHKILIMTSFISVMIITYFLMLYIYIMVITSVVYLNNILIILLFRQQAYCDNCKFDSFLMLCALYHIHD